MLNESAVYRAKNWYTKLKNEVYFILRNKPLTEKELLVKENEIFDWLKYEDITFLRLILDEAYEVYLHSQEISPSDIGKEPSPEDIFLTLTLYVNSKIFHISFPEFVYDDAKHKYTFRSLKNELDKLINKLDEYHNNVDFEPMFCQDFSCLFSKDDLNDEKFNELMTFACALYDQITDPKVKVFSLKDKISRMYEKDYPEKINYVVNLLANYLYVKALNSSTYSIDKLRERAIKDFKIVSKI